MHYKTTESLRQPWPSSTSGGWDPDVVLELIHPMRDAYRCTGDALSRDRRCMNRVGSFGSGLEILHRLSEMNVADAIKSPDLENAAGLTLCYLHKNQDFKVASQWASLLRAWASQNRKAAARTETASRKTRPQAAFTPTWKTECGDFEYVYFKPEEDDLDEYVNDLLREQFNQTFQWTKTRDAQLRHLAKLLAELKRQEAYEEKERARKEREKREQAAREKAERERKEREAERERARLAKERREKKARDRLAQEAEAWAESYEQYTEGWQDIKDLKSKEPASTQNIPWPVKSGMFFDVDAENVREFYKKAPLKDLLATAEDRVKFYNGENLRWHTDKMMQQFGVDIVKGGLKEALKTVAQVVIELRQEAKRDMKS